MANKETQWYRDQVRNHEGKTPPHLRNATSLTRFGHINFESRLQRRYGRNKADARASSVMNLEGKDGKLPFPNLARGTYHSRIGIAPKVTKKKKRFEEQEVVVETV